MGRLIIKRIQPTIKDRDIHKYGRQSSVKKVYKHLDKEIEAKQVQQNSVINAHLAKMHAEQEKKTELEQKNNTEEKNTVPMDTKEKVELANAILNNENGVKAKRIRKDKGLIERKENTIILTEDNRELLND